MYVSKVPVGDWPQGEDLRTQRKTDERRRQFREKAARGELREDITSSDLEDDEEEELVVEGEDTPTREAWREKAAGKKVIPEKAPKTRPTGPDGPLNLNKKEEKSARKRKASMVESYDSEGHVPLDEQMR